MSPSYINEITDKINNAKTIYMVLKTRKDKQQATENINQMTGLNQAQKIN